MNTLVALSLVMRFGLAVIICALAVVVGALILIINHVQTHCIRRYTRG